MNKKILVLGSTGLLGATLVPLLRADGYNVVRQNFSGGVEYRADITDLNDTSDLLDEVQPEIIINLIGLTDVDKCESQPNQAYLVNVRAVESIVKWIKKSKFLCHLIHISTDQVYDGTGIHNEENVSLTNYYAFSKYAGELIASSIKSTILRTNFFGRSNCVNRASLTDWIYDSLLNNKPIKVFDDVLFTPLSMTTLSEMIILSIMNKSEGIFNLGSNEGMSKADFAMLFAREINMSTNNMMRSTTDQVSFLKTYRPKDMRMNCSKFESKHGFKLPLLIDEIKQVAREYNEKG